MAIDVEEFFVSRFDLKHKESNYWIKILADKGCFSSWSMYMFEVYVLRMSSSECDQLDVLMKGVTTQKDDRLNANIATYVALQRIMAYSPALKVLAAAASYDDRFFQERGAELLIYHCGGLVDVQKWAFQVAGKYGGACGKYYKQGEDQRIAENKFTTDGWCLGMSCTWLGCQANGDDFWGLHETDRALADYRTIMEVQRALLGEGYTVKYRDVVAPFMTKFGLVYLGIGPRLSVQPPETVAFATELANLGQGFFLVTLGFGGPSHSTAYCRNAERVVFMDPNAGEFAFKEPLDFRSWFLQYLRKIGYSGRITQAAVHRFQKEV